MIEAIQNLWEDFVDSKFFIAVATLGTIALLGFGAPMVASAFHEAVAEGYTGPAVVQSHKVVGSFCNVEVKETTSVVTHKLVFGPKMTCSNVTDGMSVQMVKGDIKH
jgi:hypothetical protein